MDDKAVRVERYRNKASEVRIIADSMKDSEAKRILLGVADYYSTLAENLARMDHSPPASE